MLRNYKRNGLALFMLLALGFGACLLPGCSPSGVEDIGSVEADTEKSTLALGVCPPFKLRDEQGKIIDPIHGVNDKVPYSPKQTCGAKGCHDYAKITEGFHFQQGKGEKVPPKYAARYQWVSSPGNYGGNWCSPAPLYRQLAPKKNANPRTIDMTSFDFVTATCGNCHPGGGPMEYDRDGKRYDQRMLDPASGLTPGGDNGFDGDYFKAYWSETGVVEADCLLCHMPEYDYKKRNAQLADWNFRWAATAGAGFANITGKVKEGETPQVIYDLSKFDEDGNVVLHMATEPRNETCLHCHAKPGWKKRGASFTARTDVHMMAGLRCVDCHAAGSKAADPLIRGKEVHQFGKGDDPSGAVRNDLDNTVRSCEDCHLKGWRNAPIAKHNWLPPLHLDKLSCQACHIPTRTVKSALVQASDVFNPAPMITPHSKRIWVFYDQQMRFWNHYGDLNLFKPSDQPTDVTRPTLFRYKGKIYPGNQVHSAWVGYEEEGKPGLNQLFMKDFFEMWKAHNEDPAAYPQLAKITDDNKDGVIEVNRPEEIDALLSATKAHLEKTRFPLKGKRLVWVSDSRAYYSSSESKELPREQHEATPYASVYKFSHDIAPAKAALGVGGCKDCHSAGSWFFYGAVVSKPFDENGKPVTITQAKLLGISPLGVSLSTWRESYLKPLAPWLFFVVVLLVLAHYVVFGAKRVVVPPDDMEVLRYSIAERLAHYAVLITFLVLAITGFGFLLGNSNPFGPLARGVHTALGIVFAIAAVAMFAVWFRVARFVPYDWQWIAALGGYFGKSGSLPSGKFNAGQKLFFWFVVACGFGLCATGVLMIFRNSLWSIMPVVYTVHDVLAVLMIAAWIVHVYLAVVINPGAMRGIFEGKVNLTWARHHHPQWIEEELRGKGSNAGISGGNKV